ncbi:MAG: beta-N-acetylhexosaminidase [Verrucomicrobiota bacterium]|jgi:hexosaminidase
MKAEARTCPRTPKNLRVDVRFMGWTGVSGFVLKLARTFTLASLCFTPTLLSADTNALGLIPLPQKIETRAGTFQFSAGTGIRADSAARRTAEFLAERLRPATGWPFPVSSRASAGGGIWLTTRSANRNLGPEGYALEVAPDSVVIRANTDVGLFYGAETLLQLLPPQIFSTNRAAGVSWQIPCVSIEDWPRFQWRGLMLDVSRHFYSKTEVERILDEMALYKLNTFHWHLSDEPGWRIEIKKYPKLTQIGAWRKSSQLVQANPHDETPANKNTHPSWTAPSADKFGPDGRYGGYYTQADIREVVAYAAARHITIVPEIDMPGHIAAALAAYPQLGTGGPYSTDATMGMNHGVLDPSRADTFAFINELITELSRLFPGKYIHLGGDEVSADVRAATWAKSPSCQALMRREGLKNTDELQAWFTRRVEQMVNARGKHLVGWSEITGDGVTTNAVVMDWIGGAQEATGTGHDVVMAPTGYCYFDYYQSTNHLTEPPAIGGFLPLQKVYSFEPIPPNLPPQLQLRILGGQGNLWTEYVASLPHAEYMLFPRACALAEDTWSAREARNWDDFQRRLQVDRLRLDQLRVNYRRLSYNNY